MKLANLRRWLPVRPVHAHCDIPCGIYDPVSAKIAAQTVLKMVMRIDALEWGEGTDHMANSNSLSRYIAVKEQHADLVKHEVDILWHDYFKPEHLENYPDLHTTIWDATKLASANKQNVDADSAARRSSPRSTQSRRYSGPPRAWSTPTRTPRYGSAPSPWNPPRREEARSRPAGPRALSPHRGQRRDGVGSADRPRRKHSPNRPCTWRSQTGVERLCQSRTVRLGFSSPPM